MSDSRQKMGAKLAGKHLLGFDTRNIRADSPEKTVSAKVGADPPKQSVVEREIDD